MGVRGGDELSVEREGKEADGEGGGERGQMKEEGREWRRGGPACSKNL